MLKFETDLLLAERRETESKTDFSPPSKNAHKLRRKNPAASLTSFQVINIWYSEPTTIFRSSENKTHYLDKHKVRYNLRLCTIRK